MALSGNNMTLNWATAQLNAFEPLQYPEDSTTLVFLNPDAILTLTMDASNITMAIVTEQSNRTTQLLGFFGRKISPVERKYTTFNRELLAIQLSTRNFTHLLDGTSFDILMDRQPLVHASL